MDNDITDFKQYKWIVSSCLQKSLRHGRFDLAEGCVNFLWTHDRNYLTYRFGTILTEDVGIANISLIKKYLDTKLAKKQIDERGGLSFFLDITKEACESIKDRSSCDAAYFASYHSLSNTENLENTFKDVKNNYVDRINAGWLLIGNKKFKNENLTFSEENNIEKYLSLVTEITNENFSDTVSKAYETQRENISLGMAVIESAYQYEKTIPLSNSKLIVGKTVEHTHIKETSFFHKYIGIELISCGIDGHTREGKGAYYKFLKNKNPISDYFNSKGIPYLEHINLFSHCMFRIEGHEVNKRLYFPTAVNVMRDCENKVLNMKANNIDLDFSYIRNIILENIPEINNLRVSQLPMITKKIKI